ncbi:MAG: dTMP kinase [Termitinemataceae bacterium]|nr:MAG: dTMP kinase [Termitinemataceae bacterium]
MSNNLQSQGRFIVLEGIDGSGKSTVINRLKIKLQESGIPVYLTQEPSDGPIGALIRQFLSGRLETDEKAIAAMFVADRVDHLTNAINGLKKIVEGGTTVLCDRYYFSNYAYNSVFMDMDWVINANKICAEILRPDLNIFIDTDPSLCMERIKNSRATKERYEELEHLKIVREHYLRAFDKQKDVENILIVNGNDSLENILDSICAATIFATQKNLLL